jgi:hypothetical protein
MSGGRRWLSATSSSGDRNSRQSAFSGRTAWARNLETPLREVLRTETGGAAALLAAAVAALVWVNVDVSSYESLWGTTMSIDLGGAGVALDLRHWVNSGLMTFFFFVVGLEARREFDLGELRARPRSVPTGVGRSLPSSSSSVVVMSSGSPMPPRALGTCSWQGSRTGRHPCSTGRSWIRRGPLMFGLDERIAASSYGASFWIVLTVAVLLGLRHATDPDHLAAVTTLVASGKE